MKKDLKPNERIKEAHSEINRLKNNLQHEIEKLLIEFNECSSCYPYSIKVTSTKSKKADRIFKVEVETHLEEVEG